MPGKLETILLKDNSSENCRTTRSISVTEAQ